jgi:hypothetical protein
MVQKFNEWYEVPLFNVAAKVYSVARFSPLGRAVKTLQSLLLWRMFYEALALPKTTIGIQSCVYFC